MRGALASARYWGPLAAGFLCVVAALFTGPVAAWLLLVLAAGLILDGVTAMWERAGGTGNLTTHRQ